MQTKMTSGFMARAKLLGRPGGTAALAANLGRNSFFLKTLIRNVHQGAAPLKSRMFALFVTYTDMPYVAEYVYRHLDFLNASGFNVVVVSNSKKINEASLRELKQRSIAILERPNIGYDFGAYRDGILWLMQNVGSLNRILVLNDSVFGPINFKTNFINKALALNADIVGLIESMEARYHFQSFWMLFNYSLVSSKKFLDYWKSVAYYQDKATVVERLETRLLSTFLQADFKAEALFPVDVVTKQAISNFLREIDLLSRANGERSDVADIPANGQEVRAAERLRLVPRGTPIRARMDYLRQIVGILNHGVPMNPSVFMWKTLLQDFEFPYIKREIFTKNPVSEPNILSAYEVVSACGYPIELVRNYLRGAR